MARLMLKDLPRPPQRPEDYECCRRHCDPCILDYWHEAMERWREYIRGKGLDPELVLAEFERR